MDRRGVGLVATLIEPALRYHRVTVLSVRTAKTAPTVVHDAIADGAWRGEVVLQLTHAATQTPFEVTVTPALLRLGLPPDGNDGDRSVAGALLPQLVATSSTTGSSDTSAAWSVRLLRRRNAARVPIAIGTVDDELDEATPSNPQRHTVPLGPAKSRSGADSDAAPIAYVDLIVEAVCPPSPAPSAFATVIMRPALVTLAVKCRALTLESVFEDTDLLRASRDVFKLIRSADVAFHCVSAWAAGPLVARSAGASRRVAAAAAVASTPCIGDVLIRDAPTQVTTTGDDVPLVLELESAVAFAPLPCPFSSTSCAPLFGAVRVAALGDAANAASAPPAKVVANLVATVESSTNNAYAFRVKPFFAESLTQSFRTAVWGRLNAEDAAVKADAATKLRIVHSAAVEISVTLQYIDADDAPRGHEVASARPFPPLPWAVANARCAWLSREAAVRRKASHAASSDDDSSSVHPPVDAWTAYASKAAPGTSSSSSNTGIGDVRDVHPALIHYLLTLSTAVSHVAADAHDKGRSDPKKGNSSGSIDGGGGAMDVVSFLSPVRGDVAASASDYQLRADEHLLTWSNAALQSALQGCRRAVEALELASSVWYTIHHRLLLACAVWLVALGVVFVSPAAAAVLAVIVGLNSAGWVVEQYTARGDTTVKSNAPIDWDTSKSGELADSAVAGAVVNMLEAARVVRRVHHALQRLLLPELRAFVAGWRAIAVVHLTLRLAVLVALWQRAMASPLVSLGDAVIMLLAAVGPSPVWVALSPREAVASADPVSHRFS